MKNYKQTECPKCDSSDAFTIYEDGAYCFSCNYSTNKVNNNNNLVKESRFKNGEEDSFEKNEVADLLELAKFMVERKS